MSVYAIAFIIHVLTFIHFVALVAQGDFCAVSWKICMVAELVLIENDNKHPSETPIVALHQPW